MKKALAFVFAIVCAVALAGCDSGVATSGTSGDSGTPAQDKLYRVGEKVTISKDGKDLYSVTVNSVTETDKRNEYSEKTPKQVVVINYTYENLAKDDDLFVSSMSLKVIDADGNVCETYPTVDLKMAQQTPTGAKCTAEESYGLMADGKGFKMMYYDNMFNSKADATFELTTEN